MKFIVGISLACPYFAAIQTQVGMADVPQQLSALLGRGIKQFCITDEKPPRRSVIDVAVAVTAHGANHASESVGILCRNYPEVHEQIVDFKFPGKGQHKIWSWLQGDCDGLVYFLRLASTTQFR